MHPPGILEENLAPEYHKGAVDPKEAAKVCSPLSCYWDKANILT